jgi:hypothetical protein
MLDDNLIKELVGRHGSRNWRIQTPIHCNAFMFVSISLATMWVLNASRHLCDRYDRESHSGAERRAPRVVPVNPGRNHRCGPFRIRYPTV